MEWSEDYEVRKHVAADVARSVGPDDVRKWTLIPAPDLVILPLIESCASALVESWPVHRGPDGFMSAGYVDGIADAWHTDHEPLWSLDESDSSWVVNAIGSDGIRAARDAYNGALADWGLAEFTAYELTGAVAHAFRVAWENAD